MSPGLKRRSLRALALVVLLGAILPNITFIGHWNIRGLETASAHAQADSHANHCHGSSSCSDQIAYGFQWLTEGEDAVILGGGQERAQPSEDDASPADPFIAPLDPPPQYA